MADRAEGTGQQPATHETWITCQPDSAAKATEDAPDTVASSQPTAVPAPRPVLVPGYEVLEELGRGGMGVVYKARQVGLNRLVALKMILAGEHASRDDLDRFRAEAEALARLHHPNIIQIYQIDDHEGRPFFSMEFVDGGSLATHLGDAPQPPDEAARMVATLARAVHAAHQAGIVHRDLKPGNILLQKPNSEIRNPKEDNPLHIGGETEGVPVSDFGFRISDLTPKVTDFGLAKRLEDAKGRTRSGDILGTPNYMAPEQAAGHVSQIGVATDIHALGVILYRLMTGRDAFGKDTLLDTLEQVRSQEPTVPRSIVPTLPRDLEVICLKCLRKRPTDRYASALELAEDLEHFLSGEPIRARPLSRSERLRRWVRRHPVWASLAGGIALLPLLLLAGLALFRDRTFKEEEVRTFTEKEIRGSASSLRRALFERVLHGRTPDGWVRNDLSRIDNLEHEPWSHAQTLCAAFRCPEATAKEVQDLLGGMELLRTGVKRIEADGIRFGWPPRSGMAYTQAEPILWASSAIVEALRRPGLLEGKRRADYEAFLRETHLILRACEPTEPDGGWQIVHRPHNPRLVNTYVNVLALQVLLDTRRAGLPWDGSEKKRDDLLARTARWLVATFDDNGEPPGWYKDNGPHDRILDGLTLQGYSVLLRSANESDFDLPAGIATYCREHLMKCRTRTMKSPDQAAYVSYLFKRHDGKDDHVRQNLSYLWYPWAVAACVDWIEYAGRHQVPAGEIEEVRRVLGHLVVDLEAQAVTSGETFVYITAERLYALCAVPR